MGVRRLVYRKPHDGANPILGRTRGFTRVVEEARGREYAPTFYLFHDHAHTRVRGIDYIHGLSQIRHHAHGALKSQDDSQTMRLQGFPIGLVGTRKPSRVHKHPCHRKSHFADG